MSLTGNLAGAARRAGQVATCHLQSEPGGRVFLVAGRLTPTNALILEAFGRRGLEADWVRPEDALRRASLDDAVLARLDIRPSLDGPERGLSELRRLVRRGVDVLNPPPALLATHDKLETALRLARFGVPHPRTAHVGDTAPRDVVLPVVVKPRFGSWGRDVELCQTEDELERCLRRLRRRRWFRRQGALVQEFVPPLGHDLRLVIAGGEVVGAIERVNAPGEWRTNVALGGRRRATVPPPEARAIALAAASVVGADLVGVDLLPLPDGGWTVLELNGAVDFTHEYSLDGHDVFDAVASMLAPVPAGVAAALPEAAGVAAVA